MAADTRLFILLITAIAITAIVVTHSASIRDIIRGGSGSIAEALSTFITGSKP